MKKTTKTIIIGIACTLLVLGLILGIMYMVYANEKEKTVERHPVTVYIFHSTGCPHCRDAMSWLSEIVNDYDYLNVKAFQIDSDFQTNNYLMNLVGQEFNMGKEVGYIPLIVIGDSYHKTGFGDTTKSEILRTIKKESKNEKYVDVVQNVIDKNTNVIFEGVEM